MNIGIDYNLMGSSTYTIKTVGDKIRSLDDDGLVKYLAEFAENIESGNGDKPIDLDHLKGCEWREVQLRTRIKKEEKIILF